MKALIDYLWNCSIKELLAACACGVCFAAWIGSILCKSHDEPPL